MKKIIILALGVVTLCATSLYGQKKATKMNSPKIEGSLKLTQKWDKTFLKSDKVDHKKVTFKNRYGITLAGDLYIPKNRDNKKLSAIAVSGPFGAVKEQASGLYAQTMAERGFVTLAFDPSYTGESGGEPRNVSSPEINTEDFMAAVDFLGLQSIVDRNKIGIIGICGFGGMGLSAAAVDKRIKAVATAAMYDMSRVMANGFGDSMDKKTRGEILEHLSQQRWKDAENGKPAQAGHAMSVVNDKVVQNARVLPESLSADADPVTKEFFDYYRTSRGYHKNSVNSNSAFTATSPMAFMNFPLLTYIKEISPRPVLIIAGSEAHSRYFSEDAYKMAAEPKELYIIQGANHVDLYDRVDLIPFEKLATFFKNNLK